MAVLLTAAHSASCLAMARALHARGLTVLVEGQPGALSFYSRAVSQTLVGPSSRKEPEAYARFILDAVRRHGVVLVVPLDDSSLLALDGLRGELEGAARLALPSSECLRVAMDKDRLAEVAAGLGVPTPRTFRVAGLEEARRAVAALGYPLVLKPLGPGKIGMLPPGLAFKARFAARWGDVEGYLRPYIAAGCSLLVQEYYPGFGTNLDGMCADGEIVAIAARRSLKTHPLTGLVGVVRETIPMDPIVRGYAARLLGALRYDGLLNLQFRQSPRDGTWRLTDFNARASIHLGTTLRAGVDLPYLAYEWFVERRKVPVEKYAVGVRGLGLIGNVRHTALALRRREHDIDPFYPSRRKAIQDFFLDLVRADHYDEFTLADPLPALAEPFHQGCRWLSRGGRQLVHGAARILPVGLKRRAKQAWPSS